MRWRSKIKPKNGDYRTIIKFSFLPIDIDGVTIWLEKYIEFQMYVHERISPSDLIMKWYVVKRELIKETK